jgi:hypothetical protein
MANDVTNSNSNAATRDPYAEYADEVSTRPFPGDLLRFTKHGEYKAGQDQYNVPEGTKLIVHMPSMKRGWVKWEDGMPVAHLMGLVSEGFRPPPREQLGDLDEDEWSTLNDRPIDPWQKTNHLVMCDGEGSIYTFVTSSKGGLSAIGVISEAYSTRRRMKPDEIPVIELQSRSYNHKDFGETFAPVLKIIGWTKIPETFDQLTNAMADEISDESIPLDQLLSDGNGVEVDEETEEVFEEEVEERVPPPRQAAKPATRAAPQKPVQRTAPQKPVHKPTGKPTGKPAAKRSVRFSK